MSDDDIITRALAILELKINRTNPLSSPKDVKDYLCLKLGNLEKEVFAVIFLDSQNRVLGYVEMFQGTLTQTSVYPREIAKAALVANAAGVILAHPHPSGVCEPSMADISLTKALKQALGLLDIQVLDHMIVARNTTYSFAEHGIL